jgi:hypothetical protein
VEYLGFFKGLGSVTTNIAKDPKTLASLDCKRRSAKYRLMCSFIYYKICKGEFYGMIEV